jgi:hypothetical protein
VENHRLSNGRTLAAVRANRRFFLAVSRWIFLAPYRKS